MVQAEDEPLHTKSSSRSAGQATSPQTVAKNTTVTSVSRRVGASIDNSQNHEHSRVSAPATRQRFPTPESDTDSTSSCTSTFDRGSDFSSRATTPDDDDDDDDAGTRESIIARKKRELVDTSMELFTREWYKQLTTLLGIIECAAGEKRKRSAEQSNNGMGQSNAGRCSSEGGSSQKRQFAGGDGHSGAQGSEDDEDEEAGGDDRATGKKRAKRDVDKGLKFACPYLKHNPAKYAERRTCCGPGWENVHRIKEHLYRKHKAPKFICHRCNEIFRTEDQYKVHQRAASPCPLKESIPPDGFDEEKDKQLHARQKGGNLSERQKWEEMYTILFPDDLIPSPYFDKTEAKRDTNHATEDVARLEQYFRREVLPMARHELEREVDAEFDAVGEKLRSKTVDMVQNLAMRIFRTWAQGCHNLPRPSSSGPPTPDSEALAPEPAPPVVPPQQPAPAPSLEPVSLPMELMEREGFPLELHGVDFLNQFLEDMNGGDASTLSFTPDWAYGSQFEYPVAGN